MLFLFLLLHLRLHHPKKRFQILVPQTRRFYKARDSSDWSIHPSTPERLDLRPNSILRESGSDLHPESFRETFFSIEPSTDVYPIPPDYFVRSEEHTYELQSR